MNAQTGNYKPSNDWLLDKRLKFKKDAKVEKKDAKELKIEFY